MTRPVTWEASAERLARSADLTAAASGKGHPPMAAIAAVTAFAIAFILHLLGGHPGTYWTDAELIGLICMALALAAPGWPGRGPRP